MLRLSLVSASPGMVLAMPVHHPRQHTTVLLRAGASLDAHAIERLRELMVHEVWIRYPGLEDLVRFVSPSVIESYRQLTETISGALDTAIQTSTAPLDFYSYKRAVMSVLDELVANPQASMFASSIAGADQPFVRHSGNVCVLSLLMGLKLEFYLIRERSRLSAAAARDLTGLGVGAMFHDIGMTRLAPEVLARWNETGDESDPAWRDHVTLGFEMVKAHLDPAAAAIVLHHHQRFDGSGFPRRIDLRGESIPCAGSDIHIFARIVACAETFDRLCNHACAPGAPATPAVPAVRVLKSMLAPPYTLRIDPVVMRALIAVSPPYPPGSLVTLSDGRRGVVVDWTPLDPCRPTVEVVETLDHRARRPGKPERVELARDRTVTVANFDGHDVSRDNFYPKTDGEFDLARVGRALTNRADELQHAAKHGHAA